MQIDGETYLSNEYNPKNLAVEWLVQELEEGEETGW